MASGVFVCLQFQAPKEALAKASALGEVGGSAFRARDYTTCFFLLYFRTLNQGCNPRVACSLSTFGLVDSLLELLVLLVACCFQEIQVSGTPRRSAIIDRNPQAPVLSQR